MFANRLTSPLLSLAAMSLLTTAVFAQANKVTADVQLQKAIDQTLENKKKHAEKVAGVVADQIRINHKDNPAEADRIIQGWNAANGLELQAEASAARAAARQQTATPETQAEARESLRQSLQGLRTVESTTKGMKADAHNAARSESLPADVPFGPANDPRLQLPAGDVSLWEPQLDSGHIKHELDHSQALGELQCWEDAATRAGVSLANSDGWLGDLVGSATEQLVQGLQDAVDGGSQSRTASAEPQIPQRVFTIIENLTTLAGEINTHNSNLPNPPTYPLPPPEYEYWTGVINNYNTNANRLNSLRDSLLSELRSLGG